MAKNGIVAQFSSRSSVFPDVPFINVTVDPYLPDASQLQHILTTIRPEWKGKKLKHERFEKGVCNTVMKFYVDDDQKAVVVRINGDRVKIFPLQFGKERIDELKVYAIFQKVGVSPTLLGIFQNGICLEFLPGKQYGWHEAFYERNDDPFIITNMRELAKYHSKETTILAKSLGFVEKPAILDQSRVLLDTLGDRVAPQLDAEKVYNLVGRDFKATLEKELEVLAATCQKFDMPIVFCHGDLNQTNTIYDKDSDRVIFVDYESAGFNYAAHELARHVYLASCSFHTDIEDRLPSDEFILNVVRAYLEERKRHDNSVESDDETTKLWYLHVRTALPFIYYWQGLFSLHWITNQPMKGCGDEEKNEDMLEEQYWTALSRFRQYWKEKDAVLAMLKDTDIVGD